MEIDHEGEIPVYLQLAEIIRAQIESGELRPRRPIPSKRYLVERYEVARSTVDKTVAVLKSEGLIITVPGKGLFVRDRS